MASFQLSPGVKIRESDQSQYPVTTGSSGNIVAMIGYAEKGSFEPTLATSQQDYVEKYGKTIADIPYLAQGAYKYFDEGKSLLVVRAGDTRDPILYPNAAQFASKTIRLSPSQIPASSGYQEFSLASDLLAGSFAPATDYSFRVFADNRAFATPQYVESWSGALAETYNGESDPIPSVVYADNSIKIASADANGTTISVNFKTDVGTGTKEYYGTGTRANKTFGTQLSVVLKNYRTNDVYAVNDLDYITLNAQFAAVAIGTQNLTSGYDWDNTNQAFKVTIGANTFTVSLDTVTTTPATVVSAINAALAVAVNDATTVSTNLSTQIRAVSMTIASGNTVIALKKIGGTSVGFSLSQGSPDALTTLGLAPLAYADEESLVGRYDSMGDTACSGDIVLRMASSVSGKLGFQDDVNVSITSPANGNWTLDSIVTAVQARLNSAYSTFNYPKSRGTATKTTRVRLSATSAAPNGFSSVARIYAGTGNDLVSLLGGTLGAVAGAPASVVGEAVVTLKAKEKGTYGNKLSLKTESLQVRVGATTVTHYNAYVLLDGKEVSNYPRVDWIDEASENFILTRIADDPYLSIEAIDENDNSTLVRLPSAIWTLGDDVLPTGVTSVDAEISEFTVGSNGWVSASGIITSMSADFIAALDKISNPEVYDIHLVFAPGDASSVVQNAIQDFVEARKDCFGVVDAAEFGLGLGIKAKTNDITEVNEACATLNTSYVGAFWPWVQDYDADNQQYIWLPPSIYAIKAMTYTDNVSDPWYAPAGLRRGKISALDVEYSASASDRDFLYGDTNIVNPIVNFVGEGITIWGQKTAQRTKSATDRINVRRLLIYAERLIAKMARGFLFEMHDSANWSAFSRQANAILEPIRQRRGLYTFTVVCDSTTNTSALINQNIMVGKIFLTPSKVIEQIEVGFTINETGDVTFTEV